MGQNNAYAEWFINTMLGWIRWIANGIASTFQSSSSRGSAGGNFISWFSDNWITLLLVLVALGVVLDWLVWMIRWRPYWLWFRKKRVLLDDDIDAILSDEELVRQFAPHKDKPHFHGSRLGRGGRPIRRDELDEALYEDEDDPDYDEAFDAVDIEDPYPDEDPREAYREWDEGEEWDEDDDIVPEPARLRPERETDERYDDYEKERPFDQLYTDAYTAHQGDEDDEYEEYDDDKDEPDISFIEGDEDEREARRRERHERRGWLIKLRSRRRATQDDDPFSVDDAEFYDPDDDADFLTALASEPIHPSVDPDDAALSYGDSAPTHDYSRLYDDGDAELSEELAPGDGRTGYMQNKATGAPPGSRRARRERRERSE